jgi:hypothetical protein
MSGVKPYRTVVKNVMLSASADRASLTVTGPLIDH